MSHLHTQIRTAALAALTGLPTTGARVFANRLRPFVPADMPGLRLSLTSEDASTLTLHPVPIQERTVTLAIEIAARGDAHDDDVDQASLEVEQALADGLVVGGVWTGVDYTGFVFDEEALGAPTGVKRLNFRLTYACAANAPDAIS